MTVWEEQNSLSSEAGKLCANHLAELVSHPSHINPIQGSLDMVQGQLGVPAVLEQPQSWSRMDHRAAGSGLLTALQAVFWEERSTRAATWLSLRMRDIWQVHKMLHIIPGPQCPHTGTSLWLLGQFLAHPQCWRYPDLCMGK